MASKNRAKSSCVARRRRLMSSDATKAGAANTCKTLLRYHVICTAAAALWLNTSPKAWRSRCKSPSRSTAATASAAGAGVTPCAAPPAFKSSRKQSICSCSSRSSMAWRGIESVHSATRFTGLTDAAALIRTSVSKPSSRAAPPSPCASMNASSSMGSPKLSATLPKDWRTKRKLRSTPRADSGAFAAPRNSLR